MQFGSVLFLLLAASFPGAWSGLACLSNPCLHGICLDDLNSTYFCYCIDGYTGIQCQTNWNECWSSPCKNGGVCVDGVASFNCSCPPGFLGDFCEEDFDECQSNPCLNNATCLDASNGYFCSCQPGYSGVFCEIDVAVCNATNETRCANGGACLEGPGDAFFCECQPGWGAELCDVEIDECLSGPCKNGAVCVDSLADYTCICPFGFTGRHCEEKVEICRKNPCSNGALCLVEDERPTCYCVPDYHGDLCQFQYDECQLGPKCLNGGSCIDGIDNSTCSCPPQLTGVRCECLILDNNELDCAYTAPKPVSTIPSTTITEEEEEVPKTTTQVYSTTNTWTSELTKNDFSIPSTTESYSTRILDLDSSTSISTTTQEILTSTITTEFPFPVESTTGFSTKSSSEEEDFTTIPITQFSEEQTTERGSSVLPPEIGTETTLFMSSSPSSEFLDSSGSTTTDILISTSLTYSSTSLSSPQGRETNFSLIPRTETTTQFYPPSTTTEIETTSSELSQDETTLAVFDCTKSYCLNGGSCVFEPEFGYQCVCPFDTEGNQCEVVLGVQKAAFTGNSYLKHRLPDAYNISFSFEANTLSSDGLIFYASIDKLYMFLYIEGGHLKFKFSCGYQTMLLSELTVLVNNGNLMKIHTDFQISNDLKRCDASIRINESLSMTGDQIAQIVGARFSKPSAWLYLGGVPFENPIRTLPENGFIGCMHKLRIQAALVDIFKAAEDGSAVTECSSLACLSNPCRNGASCHSHGENWTCSCKNGFSGKNCEISVCENNPCLFGGTCIPFSGSGYLCLCPFGKHGHFCENDLKINEPYFSTTIRGLSSYVAYPIPGGISDTMEIKFRFTPTMMDQISLLMFIGQKGHHDFYSDHMAVSFVKGYIMLTWNLGSGPRRIFTPQPVEEGARDYLVRVGRTGRRAWLSVANLGNVTGRSPGGLVHLDVSPVLYLGGHDSRNFSTLPHDLPLHSGFSGCIFDVELLSGTLVIPLQGSRQVFGRGVGQCGTTECYEQSCQNGGVCLHHASTFMCLCQDGWFGPMCSFRQNPCDSGHHKCQSGATCVPVMFDYECDCPIGKTGEFCEKDEDITDVSLTGTRSYLSLQSFEFETNSFNVGMEIRPLDDNGILFFMERMGTSFICLSLQNGLLELKILSTNSKALNEPVTIASTRILVKGIWCRIQFGIFGRKSYLSVDNVINSAVLSTENGVNLSKEPIYIGGMGDMSLLPITATSKLPVPFKGCVRNFSVNSKQVPLTASYILSGRNVNDCDGTACGKDACLNGGTCWLDSFLKPHCSCSRPFYGNKCEKRADCDEKMCRNTGKCVESRCSCAVGWQGAYCERSIVVTTPEFTGNSYLVVKQNYYDKKRDTRGVPIKNLYLNFTTIKRNGLVLWSKKGNSFIGIGLEKGFLKIAYSLNEKVDKNFVSLPLYHKISDGLWHNIEINFAPFSIKLDQNQVMYKGKLKKLMQNGTMLTDGFFYIGGIPTKTSIYKETNGTFLEAFEGCLDGFATNGEQVIKDFTHFEGKDVGVCRIM